MANSRRKADDKEVKRLLRQCSEQDIALTKKEEEMQKLESRLTSTLHAKTKLESLLSKSENELKFFRRGNDILKAKERTSLRHRVGMVRQQFHFNKTITSKIVSIQILLTAQCEYRRKLQSRGTHQRKIEETQLKLEEEMVELLECLEPELKRANDEIKSLSAQIDEQEYIIDCLEDSKALLQEQITKSEHTIIIMNDRQCTLEGDLANMEKDMCNKHKHDKNFTTKLSQVNAELESKISEFAIEQQNKSVEIAALQAQCMHLKSKIKEGEETIKYLNLQLDEKGKQFDEMAVARGKAIENAHEKEKLANDLEAKIKEKENEIELAKEARAKTVKDFAVLCNNNNELSNKLEAAKKELAERKVIISQLEEQTASSENLQQQNEDLTQQLLEASSAHSDICNKLNSASSRIKELQIIENQFKALTSTLHVVKNERDMLDRKLQAMTVVFSNVSKQEEKRQYERQLLYDNLTVTSAKLAHCESEVQQLRITLSSREQDLKCSISMRDEQMKSFSEEKSIMNNKIAVIMEDNEAAKRRICDVETNCAAVEVTKQLLETDLEKCRVEIKQLGKELEKVSHVKVQNEQLANRVQSLTKELADIVAVQEDGSSRLCSVTDQLKEAESAVQQKQEDLEAVSAALHCARDKLACCQQDLSSKKENINQLQQIVTSLTKEIDEIKLSVTCNDDNEKLIGQLRSDVNHKKKEYEEVVVANHQLKMLLKKMQSRICEIKTDIDQSHSDIASITEESDASVLKLEETVQTRDDELVKESIVLLNEKKEMQTDEEKTGFGGKESSLTSQSDQDFSEEVLNLEHVSMSKDSSTKTFACKEDNTNFGAGADSCSSNADVEVEKENIDNVEEATQLTAETAGAQELTAEKEIVADTFVRLCCENKMIRDYASLKEDHLSVSSHCGDLEQQILQIREQNQQLETQLHEVELQLSLSTEREEHLKTEHASLLSKTEPFRSLLDEYEAEKEFLLNENESKQLELEKLAQQYASLLGHQNKKQKIRHILKLKEENLALKNELTKQHSTSDKQKRKIQNLERQVNEAQGVKCLHHLQAFERAAQKENVLSN